MTQPKPLRLIAQDIDDLAVISAALQDSVLKASNLNYAGRSRRFTLEVNRYRWETDGNVKARVRAILGIDAVLGVRTRAVTRIDPDMVMSLLNVSFAADDEPPGGTINLLFSGDGELAVRVEALDVTLIDSDYAWPTGHTPDHEKRRR